MPTGETKAEEILNLEEASRYLHIRRRTLYTLAARGMVPGAKIGGQWRDLAKVGRRPFENPDLQTVVLKD